MLPENNAYTLFNWSIWLDKFDNKMTGTCSTMYRLFFLLLNEVEEKKTITTMCTNISNWGMIDICFIFFIAIWKEHVSRVLDYPHSETYYQYMPECVRKWIWRKNKKSNWKTPRQWRRRMCDYSFFTYHMININIHTIVIYTNCIDFLCLRPHRKWATGN